MHDDLDDYLSSIATGDSHAYGQWLARAEPRVRASLASFATGVDVEAVVQECLLRVWQVAPRVVPDGRPNALLRLSLRIARNLAISELRRLRVRPSVVAELSALPEPTADPVSPDPFLREHIERCRDALPSKPALALQARLHGAGLPDRDLADSVKMKLNTFLQNVSRARKLLADCLTKQGVDLRTEVP